MCLPLCSLSYSKPRHAGHTKMKRGECPVDKVASSDLSGRQIASLLLASLEPDHLGAEKLYFMHHLILIVKLKGTRAFRSFAMHTT